MAHPNPAAFPNWKGTETVLRVPGYWPILSNSIQAPSLGQHFPTTPTRVVSLRFSPSRRLYHPTANV